MTAGSRRCLIPFLAALLVAGASAAIALAQGQPPDQPAVTVRGQTYTPRSILARNMGTEADQTTAFPPHRVIGNIYYVGTNSLATFLIATPQGHILIDTGTQKMAAVVFPNIVKLGYKPADIKLMLISHAHYDHMETMETIRRITGATVAALEAEVPALVSGHDLSSNETWGQEPIQVGRVLKSGDDVTLGGSTIKVIWTPGHTLGAAAYFINTQENGRAYQIVFGGPPGPITGDAKYDTRPEDAFNSYKALRALNPDILISGHPQNLLKGKLDALWANKRPSPLALQPGQWTKMIDDSEANFRKRLAETNAPAR